MSIHENLKNLRLNAGLTQDEAAEKAGVTRQTISGYETGRRQPDLEMLQSLAEMYGASINEVFYGTKERKSVKVTAVITAAIYAVVCFAESLLRWLKQGLFPITSGTTFSSSEEIAYMKAHFRLGKLASNIGAFGSWVFRAALLVLTVLSVTVGKKLRPGEKVRYFGMLALIFALTVLPFSLTDRIFYMDYYERPVFGLIFAALCLAVSLIIGAVRKHRAK